METRNNKEIIIAFDTFQKFYRQMQHIERTYEQFITSNYYIAFVKFGNYCVNSKVISVSRYANYLIKNEIRIDDWNKDKTYEDFLKQIIRIETADEALERTINFSIKWSDEKQMNSNDLFRACSTFSLIRAINDGKISPWVIYQSISGPEMLQKMNGEGIEMIWDMIDPEFWNTKFDNNKDDVTFLKTVLKDGGW